MCLFFKLIKKEMMSHKMKRRDGGTNILYVIAISFRLFCQIIYRKTKRTT